MKNIIYTIIIIYIIIVLSEQITNRNKWNAFYYPNKNNINNEENWIIKTKLNSLQECKNWIENIATKNNKRKNSYDYECGYKCKYNNSIKLYICETTTH